MKAFKAICLFFILCAAAFPQTEDLGMGAFANEAGPIMLAVDAGLVNLQQDNPYAMFILYMAAKGDSQEITVARNDVVMIFKDREYPLPSVEELRKNYRGEIRDIDFYRHLGKEGIISSWIRFYKFPKGSDFFPPLTQTAPLAVDQGSMTNHIGFRTKCYFKNPGFAKWDTLVIRVKDKKNPELMGEVTVTLK
jgi:hypothetical protein